MAEDDESSIFSYDGEADPDTFSLSQLGIAVNAHFGMTCRLEKLAEGGYHKVYEVLQEEGALLGIVRVAAPAFPRDKLESEVATLRYLAAQTKVPVPQVYAWNSDASNPVGAEYMIMQKIPGVSADKVWDTLPMNTKKRVVAQIGAHFKAIFALRFDRAGSLYLSSPSRSDVYVGPIISEPFYRALDGVVRVPDAELQLRATLLQYRGPFTNASDYLQSSLLAELYLLTHHRSIVFSELKKVDKSASPNRLEIAERTLHEALHLCSVYPGNNHPGGPICAPSKPFSLSLDDFRLSNIMIDEQSGVVTGIIDFEGTRISPLWECAIVPGWLLPFEDPEGRFEGGPTEDRQVLHEIFWTEMESTEWCACYTHGKAFRHFRERLLLQASTWASEDVAEWVEERAAWAKIHPGVAFPED